MLSNFGSEVGGCLGADPLQRRRIMETILDRQYRRLTSLGDASEEEHTVGHFVPSYYGREDFEVLKNRVFDNMDFRHLSSAILKYCRGINLMAGMNATIIEDIDSSTVYTRFKVCTNVWCSGPESKLLAKRFIEQNRIVFVWTTIREDELYPESSTNIQPTDCSWLVIEDATENNNTSIKRTKLRVVAKSAILFKQISLEENLQASREHNRIISENSELYMQNFETEVLDMAKLETS